MTFPSPLFVLATARNFSLSLRPIFPIVPSISAGPPTVHVAVKFLNLKFSIRTGSLPCTSRSKVILRSLPPLADDLSAVSALDDAGTVAAAATAARMKIRFILPPVVDDRPGLGDYCGVVATNSCSRESHLIQPSPPSRR